jgi:hypothetical protein
MKTGEIWLAQLDRMRLVKRLDALRPATLASTLQTMFAP